MITANGDFDNDIFTTFFFKTILLFNLQIKPQGFPEDYYKQITAKVPLNLTKGGIEQSEFEFEPIEEEGPYLWSNSESESDEENKEEEEEADIDEDDDELIDSRYK